MKKLRKMKRILTLFLALILAVSAVACKPKQELKTVGFQLDMPSVGEEVAVFKTSLGNIWVRLFPEVAPVAVENLKALINKNYYDGITFHRVVKDFVDQFGDPTATGRGGEKGVDKPIESTFNMQTVLLKGALSYAHSGDPSAASSQIFFVAKNAVTESEIKWIQGFEDAGKYPEGTTELYKKYGGTPELDGIYNTQNLFIAFGQTFSGLDVIDKINAVQTVSSKPVVDVVVIKAELVKYKEGIVEQTPVESYATSEIDTSNLKPVGFQLEKPAKGEEIAVFTTSMGTIKVRLFADQAPVSVENFKALVNKKYYDGITFHRVVKDSVIQTGDPTGTGTGGEKGVDKTVESTFNMETILLRGALSYAHLSGDPTTADSQIFFPSKKTVPESYLSTVEQYEAAGKYPKGTTELYRQHGGTPEFDGVLTPSNLFVTFGQTFEGLDVIDKINNVETSSDKPVQDVKLISVRLEKYQ